MSFNQTLFLLLLGDVIQTGPGEGEISFNIDPERNNMGP